MKSTTSAGGIAYSLLSYLVTAAMIIAFLLQVTRTTAASTPALVLGIIGAVFVQLFCWLRLPAADSPDNTKREDIALDGMAVSMIALIAAAIIFAYAGWPNLAELRLLQQAALCMLTLTVLNTAGLGLLLPMVK